MKTITQRQLETLEFIEGYTEANQIKPRQREIAEFFNIRPSGVRRHIQLLQFHKLLKPEPRWKA